MTEKPPVLSADLQAACAQIDAAIAACGGDVRTTIAALLADNAALQRELDFASLAMSYGFSRGWFARRRETQKGAGDTKSDCLDQPC